MRNILAVFIMVCLLLCGCTTPQGPSAPTDPSAESTGATTQPTTEPTQPLPSVGENMGNWA